jgi:tetratricopeptide (TPR) repeat protein
MIEKAARFRRGDDQDPMTLESKIVDPSEIEATDAQASVLMKQGIRLLQESEADPEAALQCFDRALDLRRRLPDDVPIHAYGLAACWLNRADALMRLGGARSRVLAIEAFDEAIALLSPLPLSEDPRFVRRLVIAHQNRGLALCALAPPATDGAVRAFLEAIAVLDHEQANSVPDQRYLLAVVWMNLANAQTSKMTNDGDDAARDAARRAVAFIAPAEREDPEAAAVGLKARHILCQTIARQLSLDAAGAGPMPDEVHEATDLAEDGLSLARHWERHGVSGFRDVAADLFRFGAAVYGRFQPHFLEEFIAEHREF